jgi:peptide/nickel transport system substrate-binding protein
MLIAGRYLLAETIGQGGMGRVWRGHDRILDRVVAVKEVILPPQSPEAHAELLTRMVREARAAARLDHPSVITIHDVVEHGGTPWIVMQFVAGTSLRARIDSGGPLHWSQVADIGAQVAEALAEAHAAGIVHRDLKPDNILLSGRRAIVTDFGIARIMDATTQLTGTGVRVGTPLYMAPENLDGGVVGPAADLWALGATLYTAVEGVPPFSGQTMTALIAAILTRPPDQPQHAGPLREILVGLLARDPARRPDARTAARALAACRSGRHAAVTAPGVRPSPAPVVVAPDPLYQPTVSRQGFPGGRPAVATQPATAFQPQPPGLAPASRNPRRRLGPRSVLAVAAVAVAATVLGVLLTLPGGPGKSPGSASPAATRTLAIPPGNPSASASASASTPGTSADVTADLSVVSCPTSLGTGTPPTPVELPATEPVSVPAGTAADLAVYADEEDTMQLVGPKDWGCTASYGADGNGGVEIYPRGETVPQTKLPAGSAITAIVGREVPACYTCALTQACPLFASAAKQLSSALGQECPARPAAESVTSIGSGLVSFEDPPGVSGDGTPSGGKYPANGVMTFYQGGAVASSWLETCTLPDSERAECTATLNDFTGRYGKQ